MKLPGLDKLPGHARIWVFGTDRELQGPETAALLRAVDGFLEAWTAHGVPLRAARSWRYGRFLVVGADEDAAPPSGCSIDALVRRLKEVEDGLGFRFVGNEAVWYRDFRGEIRHTSRPGFRALVRKGRVTRESVVFDNSITRLAELRGSRWEGPASGRWQAAFFR